MMSHVCCCFRCSDSLVYNFNDYASDEDYEPNQLTGIDGVDVNTDNGSCFDVVVGCMDSNAWNFNDYNYDGIADIVTGINGTDINTHDYSYCEYQGCTNSTAANYEAGQILTSFGDYQAATIDDGSRYIPGCTLENFPNVTVKQQLKMVCHPFSSDIFIINDAYLEYDSAATNDNGTCLTPVILGCIDDTMWNIVKMQIRMIHLVFHSFMAVLMIHI